RRPQRLPELRLAADFGHDVRDVVFPNLIPGHHVVDVQIERTDDNDCFTVGREEECGEEFGLNDLVTWDGGDRAEGRLRPQTGHPGHFLAGGEVPDAGDHVAVAHDVRQVLPVRGNRHGWQVPDDVGHATVAEGVNRLAGGRVVDDDLLVRANGHPLAVRGPHRMGGRMRMAAPYASEAANGPLR